MKSKSCAVCHLSFLTLYRVQTKPGKEWIFTCEQCLVDAKLSPHYRYGGTWQGKRH